VIIACSLPTFLRLPDLAALCEVFLSHPRTINQHRSVPLNAAVPPCLRHTARSYAPMNTHANGGGSVQLGSIRNPDRLP
jgi:hypothetical protein